MSSLKTGCVKCALDKGLESLKDYKGSIRTGVIILIVGEQPDTVRLGNVLDIVNNVTIHGFVISLSDDNIAEDLYKFANNGKVWGVSKYMVGHAISSFISEVFMDIINTVEEVNMVKIHSQTYFQSQVESTFSVEYGLQGNLFVMLYIDDEMKVEHNS